jgi:glycogen operon protein
MEREGTVGSELMKHQNLKIYPGSPIPLGAHCVGEGVNFAVYSRHSDAAELCLFEPEGREEVARVTLPGRSGDIWHGFVPGLKAGQLYGYRVTGPYKPRQGHRFNRDKLLIDPYTRELHGNFQWRDEIFGYSHEADEEWNLDPRDSAPCTPKSVVPHPQMPPFRHPKPETSWSETIIYELHVKGFTKLHPEVPDDLRGTYLGLAHPVILGYLRDIGITAVELLPCQAFISEERLASQGLSNYWGYNPLAFFAPHPGYARSDPVAEFRQMVDVFHGEGIEVILDVVFNHTGEGGEQGPTLSFRGIDNRSYYLLDPADLRRTVNFSGCGNTLDISNPEVLRLVMDCLRFWCSDMGVDGFRFDLATSLGRRGAAFDPRGAFFSAVHQDPVLGRAKLIAEPWDLGPEGYRLGQFPPLWSEWNDRYRETVRSFWRGDPAKLPEFAERIAGSSDYFRNPGRHPRATINYVACHDGFTLRDVVSYERKHNEANLEANRDGSHHNVSWNSGREGETDDPEILRLRRRQRRNLLATVLLSQGVPMLMAGDEFGRTQGGNNNAYCQDNEISWLDWNLAGNEAEMVQFVSFLNRIRKENPVFRRISFLEGVIHPVSSLKDVTWLREDGEEMAESDWRNPERRTLGVLLDRTGVDIRHRNPHDRDPGGSFLLLFNAASSEVEFTLPAPIRGDRWRVVFDTREKTATTTETGFCQGHVYGMSDRSMAVLGELA